MPVTDAPVRDPTGAVVPPAVAKTASADDPLPDGATVVLLVGTKIASKEQVPERTFENVALVDPTAPFVSAYAQPMNW